MIEVDRAWRLLATGQGAAAVWTGLVEGQGPLALAVAPLHGVNGRLWALEEAVRDRALADVEIVRLKRAIDAENLARHDAVHTIDRAVDACFGLQRAPDDEAAVVDSQSVGQMVDRLSVLALKVAAWAGTPARRAALEAQRLRVGRCLDRVGWALARGEGTAQAFDEAKTYSA